LDKGGCPITGYAVFRDDGNGTDLIYEMNAVSDPLVRNIPTLRTLNVTNFVGIGSTAIRFKVRAFNKEGYSDSTLRTILLAGVPITPTSAPKLD
jgi:hypothetical protein